MVKQRQQRSPLSKHPFNHEGNNVMQADLTHYLLTQAIKRGRTITIRAADGIESNAAGDIGQLLHLEVRPTAGGNGCVLAMPTQSTKGVQLRDDFLIQEIRRMGKELDEHEATEEASPPQMWRNEDNTCRTNTPNAWRINDQEAPAGSHIVSAQAMGVGVGDEPRIFANAVTRKSIVFAQVSVMDGYALLSLRYEGDNKKELLTSPKVIDSIKPGEWFTLACCCGDGFVAAMATSESGEIARCRASCGDAGTKFGLGSGNVANEVRFSQFACGHHSPTGCGDENCTSCGGTCPCCGEGPAVN